MKKNFRWIVFIPLALAIILTIGIVAVNSIVTNKLEKYVKEELPKNMEGSYTDLSVRLLNGTIAFSYPSLEIRNENDTINHTFVNLDELTISGLSYWKYLMDDEIHLDKILLKNPKIIYYKDRNQPENDSTSTNPTKFSKPIFMDLLQIDNAKVTIYETGKDSTKLSAKNLFLKIEEVKIDSNTISQKIPALKKIEAHSDSVFFKANNYDNLEIKKFEWKNKNITLTDVGFYTKYSRAEYSKILDKERDHYRLSMESFSILNFNFGFNGEEYYAQSDNIIMDTPSLLIYRDKLLPDDLSIKPLYSKSLRELPFRLTVDSLNVKNGFLKYQERVNPKNRGGYINFENLNIAGSKLSNTYKNPAKTELKINAEFMENTPLSILWSFDVQNETDAFVFQAQAGVLHSERMNRFTEPNLNVRLTGKADKTYFTINGNNNESQIDMKIKYSDFKVNLLKKDSKKKKTLFSAIVNIFISKDSEQKDESFKECSDEEKRDKTKSVFNLLWISIKGALTACLT